MLCGARGAPAARLPPHVDDVVVWDPPPEPDGAGTDGLVRRLRLLRDVRSLLGH